MTELRIVSKSYPGKDRKAVDDPDRFLCLTGVEYLNFLEMTAHE